MMAGNLLLNPPQLGPQDSQESAKSSQRVGCAHVVEGTGLRSGAGMQENRKWAHSSTKR
jgi:hypothetical protein